MDNLVVMSLMVSVVGMLLLFVALAFLYGIMRLMTVLLKDRTPETARPVEGRDAAAPVSEAVRRAAVAAVALARADSELHLAGFHVAGASRDAGPVSPWWVLHHSRRLLDRPARRRSR